MSSESGIITPHILSTKGDIIENLSLFGYPITTTIFSTWIFMILLFFFVALFSFALKTRHCAKLRTFGLDTVKRLDDFLIEIVGKKKTARMFFILLGGLFVFILFGNLFGILVDWITVVIPSAAHYLRPFNSDLSTTLSMAVAVILIAQVTSMIHKGFFRHWQHYVCNFSGDSLTEKIINVPVGWIHFISEFSRILSLSLRLYVNIFAGIIMIAVMVYLGKLLPLGFLGGILVLPFWFFELLVAFLQAFIFMMLAALYIEEAVTVQEHA